MTRLPNNPSALILRGSEAILGMDNSHCDASGLVPGHHAFAAAWEERVYVFDVSDSMSPTLVSRLLLTGLARSVEIAGGRLYVDMVDPAATGWLEFFPWHDRWGRVLVVDIDNPLEPKLIDMLPVGASGDLLAYGGTLWHTSYEAGVSAWEPR